MNSGAFANPNDNAYFSQVEGMYKRMPKSNHIEAIKAILSACYKPSDDNILNYWKKCLYGRSNLRHSEVNALISSHWLYDDNRREKYESYCKEYDHFKHGDRLLSDDVRRLELPLSIGENTLDGHY